MANAKGKVTQVIGAVVDVPAVVEYASSLPNVVHAQTRVAVFEVAKQRFDPHALLVQTHHVGRMFVGDIGDQVPRFFGVTRKDGDQANRSPLFVVHRAPTPVA